MNLKAVCCQFSLSLLLSEDRSVMLLRVSVRPAVSPTPSAAGSTWDQTNRQPTLGSANTRWVQLKCCTTDLVLLPPGRHKADGHTDLVTIFMNHSRNHLKEHNASCDKQEVTHTTASPGQVCTAVWNWSSHTVLVHVNHFKFKGAVRQH